MAFAFCLLPAPPALALPQKLGDFDEDGIATVLDLTRLNAHIAGTQPLSAQFALFADLNKDGFINEADRDELIKEILQTRTPKALPLATVRFTSPFADDGTRGGKVGLAPVASDRLPEPLPPGLHHALDISIQTDGPTNFDRPVPVRFPNLPDPVTGIKLGPWKKSALWSCMKAASKMRCPLKPC